MRGKGEEADDSASNDNPGQLQTTPKFGVAVQIYTVRLYVHGNTLCSG